MSYKKWGDTDRIEVWLSGICVYAGKDYVKAKAEFERLTQSEIRIIMGAVTVTVLHNDEEINHD